MTILQTDITNTNKQLINAVSQSSYKCAETSELNLFHGHTCLLRFFGTRHKRVQHDIYPVKTKVLTLDPVVSGTK